MHATMRTYSATDELTDALLEHESEIRQLLGGIEGFRAYYLVRTDTGATTISVFDDQAGAEESTRVAAAWVADHLGAATIAAPQVTTGEVALSF